MNMKEVEEMVIEITELLSDSNCDDCRRLTLVVSVVDLVYLNTYNIHESLGIIDHVKNLVLSRYQIDNDDECEF